MRGFLAAIARAERATEARRLADVALAVRGEPRALERALDRLARPA